MGMRWAAWRRGVRWGIAWGGVLALTLAFALAAAQSDCGRTAEVPGNGPNPMRAHVAEEIVEWRDWLIDGGFEAGNGAIEILDHPQKQLAPALVERTTEAARSGDWGLRIDAGPGQGTVVALRSPIEKGEETRVRFHVRSLKGPYAPRIRVLGVEKGRDASVRVLYTPETPRRVGEAWSMVEFSFFNTQGLAYALVAIEVGANTVLEIDDAAIEAEHWAMAPATRCMRRVGEIDVPIEAAAPVHFNVLIHIEDPKLITQQEGYFREKTAVFTELARTFSEHGGFLTIQPEEDWPMAALRFAPDTLSMLADEYDVVYSTHTHGPACRDNEGRLRSSQDCNACRSCAGWDSVENDADPTTPEYVGDLRDLISEISGTEVSDHNGNWHYDNVSRLADEGIRTWSAFKDHNTQATFEELFTNPWRPTLCDAIASPEVFFTHDPSTDVIFVPGWGQAITRNPERIHDRLAAMLSQVLQYADAGRVNAFYIVTHVDHYSATAGEPYIEYVDATGELIYHAPFLQDLAYWEETLSELIDPLVAEGYLAWTSLPEIGRLFESWESGNRGS